MQAKLALFCLKNLTLKKYKIIFLDEVCFTKHVNQPRDWSRRGSNSVKDMKAMSTKMVAVIGAISAEVGLELTELHERSVNTERWIEFL